MQRNRKKENAMQPISNQTTNLLAIKAKPGKDIRIVHEVPVRLRSEP